MLPTLARSFGVGMLMAIAGLGQETVCGIFKDLKAFDGRQLILTGELILSKDFAAIGAVDCDNRYSSDIYIWPTALRLRPSSKVPAEAMRRFRDAANEADRLRHEGKTVSASISVAGRVRLIPVDDLAAEFTFDAIEDLKVNALPDSSELPVIPICELFQNLTSWKGQRIAVRGEVVGTSEGSWLVGRCKGGFYTNGYRWPVSLSYAGPAYDSSSTEPLSRVKRPSTPPKGFDTLRGIYIVVRSATYVGRLRLRDEYKAGCRPGGDYITNGFGHLNGAAGEIIVEEVRNVELSKPSTPDVAQEDELCQPPNLAALCETATLSRAAALGCTDRVSALLAKDGIDSRDGNASDALSQAIRTGNETM